MKTYLRVLAAARLQNEVAPGLARFDLVYEGGTAGFPPIVAVGEGFWVCEQTTHDHTAVKAHVYILAQKGETAAKVAGALRGYAREVMWDDTGKAVHANRLAKEIRR